MDPSAHLKNDDDKYLKQKAPGGAIPVSVDCSQ